MKRTAPIERELWGVRVDDPSRYPGFYNEEGWWTGCSVESPDLVVFGVRLWFSEEGATRELCSWQGDRLACGSAYAKRYGTATVERVP